MRFPFKAVMSLWDSAHLPSPNIPVVPLDRHRRRNFSTGSLTIVICRLALPIISASCRVFADCGLLNIPEIYKQHFKNLHSIT
jgi:hypothetical protein